MHSRYATALRASCTFLSLLSLDVASARPHRIGKLISDIVCVFFKNRIDHQIRKAPPPAIIGPRSSNGLGGSDDFFNEIVLNGAMKDAGMAPFKAVLDKKDVAAIRAHLIKRANEDKVSGAKQSKQ